MSKYTNFKLIPDSDLEKIRGGMMAVIKKVSPSGPPPPTEPFSGREFMASVARGVTTGAMWGKAAPGIGPGRAAMIGGAIEGVGYCVEKGCMNIHPGESPGYDLMDPKSLESYVMGESIKPQPPMA